MFFLGKESIIIKQKCLISLKEVYNCRESFISFKRKSYLFIRKYYVKTKVLWQKTSKSYLVAE